MFFGTLPVQCFEPALTWLVDLDHEMGPRAWLGERTPWPTIHLPADTTPEQRSLIFWAYEMGFNTGRDCGEQRIRDGLRDLLGIRVGL